MRITQSQLYQSQVVRINQAYEKLFLAQDQLASGKRLLRPSDDPAGLKRSMSVRTARGRLEQVRENASSVRVDLTLYDTSMQTMLSTLVEATDHALSGANGTSGPSTRRDLGVQVDGLIQDFLQLANARGTNGFLYSGANDRSRPFNLQNVGGVDQVLYSGSPGRRTVDLGNSQKLESSVSGSQLTPPDARGPTVYRGSTGATAGSGNDSARGTQKLLVSHTRSILGGGGFGGDGDPVSQLQLGLSSNALDTVLGPGGSHTLTLVDTSGTGASGTISLNGGATVQWTAADTDLAVTGPDGERIHLDLSSITAGFSGSVSIEGQGTVSLDAGATSSPIDFSNSNLLVSQANVGLIFVNATGIRTAGTETLQFPGTYDAFSSLIELRDQLKNTEGLGEAEQVDRIRAMLPELERSQEQIRGLLADVGRRLRLAQQAETRSQEFDVVLAQEQSQVEDIDFARVASELSRAETMLQAAIAISARLAQLPSLVDRL